MTSLDKKIITGIFFSILALFSCCALALDCNNTTLEWESTVCANPNLIKLESKLQAAIKNGKCNDFTQDFLDQWHDGIAEKDDDVIESDYANIMEQVSFCNGDAKIFYHKPKPDAEMPQPTIQYVMASLQLNGKEIGKYPELSDSKKYADINAEINAEIKGAIDAYFKGNVYRGELPFADAAVFAANANLFGVELPIGEGNPGTGYDESYTEKHLWDLDNGKDIEKLLDYQTFTVKKDKYSQFWKILIKGGGDQRYRTHAFEGQDCSEYEKDHQHAGYYIRKNSFEVSDEGTSGADRGCGHTYDVKYSEVKDLITVNQEFIRYLPRLIEAELISKELGNEILHDYTRENIYMGVKNMTKETLNTT